MAKDRFLQIRLSTEDIERIRAVAEANFLDTSVWARAILLRAVAAVETESANRDHSAAIGNGNPGAGPSLRNS